MTTSTPPQQVAIDPVQVAQRLATRIAHLELENAELHATVEALHTTVDSLRGELAAASSADVPAPADPSTDG